MRYVILRDDDVNALTPIDCLERLYKPFIDRRLPVNLAVIPNVSTKVLLPNGQPEYFLFTKQEEAPDTLTIGSNKLLVKYLLDNNGYHIAQHGYRHDVNEFDSLDRQNIIFRMDQGMKLLMEAGFDKPKTFIAPYNKLSWISFQEAAKRYPIISTNWFQRSRLPFRWWPQYAVKKILNKPHWKAGKTILLSHPSSYLSCFRPYDTILEGVKANIQSQTLTVLLTHWWEYFRENKPDQALIDILHRTADYLANDPDIKVISFDNLLTGHIPI